jgi:FMN phosphatase YigB (HAD superfamily)
MENKKIKLIIFDAYGVILTGGYPDTCKYLAKKFKVNWQDVYDVIYKKYCNKAAMRDITQKEAWENSVRELNLPIKWQEVRSIHYSLMGINKRVAVVAEKYRDSEIRTLLLSKNTRSQFSDVSKMLGFKKYFNDAINTWELGLPKASKKTLDYLMKRYGVKPDEIVYIDDQKENLKEAKKIGVKTIFYQSFEQFLKELNKYLKN